MPEKETQEYNSIEQLVLALSEMEQLRLVSRIRAAAPVNSPLKTIITLLDDADI